MGDEEASRKDAKGKDAKEAVPWPPKVELEKWLMRTAKDTDHGAAFLRKMLHMNPAYGAYLVGDEDLAGIVQSFAKRFRGKVLSLGRGCLEDPAAKFLYEPLCEISWRVIGHVLHTIVDLEDNENFPVPKEALGQVKMLLQTNVALSKKFNDMRRAYLKELSGHRDRQRVLPEQVQQAVNQLHEEPIMFYEPLDFVLDDATKQFVQEVVEERMKLGLLREARPVEVFEREELDPDADPEKQRMWAEMKNLRTAAAREQAQAEQERLIAAKAKAALQKAQEQLQKLEEEAEELRIDNDGLRKQRNELSKRLGEKPETIYIEAEKEEVHEERQVEVVHVPTAAPVVEVHAPVEVKSDATGKLRMLEKDNRDLARELGTARAELEALRKLHHEESVHHEVPQQVIQPVAPVEKIVVDEGPLEELRKQLAKCMKIEKELREANKSLEKALEENKEKPKYRSPAGDPKDIDEEIQKSVSKVTDQLKRKIKEQAEEIERLTELLEKQKSKKQAHSEEEEGEKKPKKVREVVVKEGNDDIEGEKARRWREKYSELEDKYKELDRANEKLEHQVRLLLDRIKKYGGDAAVKEIMAEVELSAPPPSRKKRKLKAYERLYLDAMRRIIEMRRRRAELEKQERKLLISAATYVKDRKTLRQVENLTHLHRASVATQHRFHDALTRFHQERVLIEEKENTAEQEEYVPSDDEVKAFGYGYDFANGAFMKPGEREKLDMRASALVQMGEEVVWHAPMVVAAEFERLRSENRQLAEEVVRLRALLPTHFASTSRDTSSFGMRKSQITTKDMMKRAETGLSLTLGSTTSVIMSSSLSRQSFAEIAAAAGERSTASGVLSSSLSRQSFAEIAAAAGERPAPPRKRRGPGAVGTGGGGDSPGGGSSGGAVSPSNAARAALLSALEPTIGSGSSGPRVAPARQLPPPLSQPVFAPLTLRKGFPDPAARGTREAQLAGTNVRPLSPHSEDEGSSSRRPAGGEPGHGLGLLMQRPLLGAHAATWGPGLPADAMAAPIPAAGSTTGGSKPPSREAPPEGRRAPSSHGTAAAAQLSAPWRTHPADSLSSSASAPVVPPARGQPSAPLPPGASSQTLTLTAVLGRVPSTGALEPLAGRHGCLARSRSASPDESRAIGSPDRAPLFASTGPPAGWQVGLAAAASGPPAAPVAPAPPKLSSAPSAPLLPSPPTTAPASPQAPPPSSGGAPRATQVSAANKGPKRRSGAGKDENALSATVKAKPNGFCVTPLRSQEHMMAMAQAA